MEEEREGRGGEGGEEGIRLLRCRDGMEWDGLGREVVDRGSRVVRLEVKWKSEGAVKCIAAVYRKNE